MSNATKIMRQNRNVLPSYVPVSQLSHPDQQRENENRVIKQVTTTPKKISFQIGSQGREYAAKEKAANINTFEHNLDVAIETVGMKKYQDQNLVYTPLNASGEPAVRTSSRGGPKLVVGGITRQTRGMSNKLLAKSLADPLGTVNTYQSKLNAAKRAQKLIEQDRLAIERYIRGNVGVIGGETDETKQYLADVAHSSIMLGDRQAQRAAAIMDDTNPANDTGEIVTLSYANDLRSSNAARRIFGN